MECEVPWLEDARVTRALQLKTRGTSMRAPSNDYICRIKTFSTFLGRWRRFANQLASPLDFLPPLPPEQDPPK